MSTISTHVLDLARGRPAEGIRVVLERAGDNAWTEIGHGQTDGDGRVRSFVPAATMLATGTYRLRFATAAYFTALGTRAFYPEIHVVFQIEDASGHYHVPLLLSPFGYSTYRGS